MKEAMVMGKQEAIIGTKGCEADMEKLRALYALKALERAAKAEILVAGEEGEPFAGTVG